MVSVSISLNQELYKKAIALQDEVAAANMKEVSLSSVINHLVKLGFAYKEKLRHEDVKLQTKQTTIDAKLTDLVEGQA